ncbi:MAG TPA: DUF481 domain-containing protein [Polyangiaceae bacterium]
MKPYLLLALGFASATALVSTTSFAQDAPSDTANDPTGAAPADAKALVAAPTSDLTAPEVDADAAKTHSTTVSLSAGGQWQTGNSQLLAGTVNGALDMRRGMNGFGASLLGNYGQGAPQGKDSVLTSENIQGRLRYDRYLIEKLSLFLIGTGRYDRFQGLDFRLNIDPGVKYLFVNAPTTSLWGEAGYDFQYDIRRNADRVVVDGDGNPVLDANGQIQLLDKTKADHSGRLFAGLKHAFNKEVTLTTGLEYLQSFVESTRYRLNYDALVAANIGAGLSLGVGFSLRYDHDPLPGKANTDTSTTLNVIYAFSDVAVPKKDDDCPCKDKPVPTCPPDAVPPPPPPESAPATQPATTTPDNAAPPVQTITPPQTTTPTSSDATQPQTQSP